MHIKAFCGYFCATVHVAANGANLERTGRGRLSAHYAGKKRRNRDYERPLLCSCCCCIVNYVWQNK